MSNYQVDLTGKVVLVTGGSRGLGKAMSIGAVAADTASLDNLLEKLMSSSGRSMF